MACSRVTFTFSTYRRLAGCLLLRKLLPIQLLLMGVSFLSYDLFIYAHFSATQLGLETGLAVDCEYKESTKEISPDTASRKRNYLWPRIEVICSLLVLRCLFYETAFPEILKWMACVFSEILSSKFPSRAVVGESSSLCELTLENVPRDWNCRLFC
jgi:hypothetical protein